MTTTAQILKDGGRVKASTEVYIEEGAVEKLALAMAFNRCDGVTGPRAIRIDTFVKTRCKYDGKKGLPEEQIKEAEELADLMIQQAQEADQQALAELSKKPHIPEAVRKKAEEIIRAGTFIDEAKKVFQKIWLGDAFVLQAIFYVNATYFVENPNEPVHLHISGSTQAGKTESARTALQLVPPWNYLIATATPKALHYDAGQYTHPEMMILWDEGLTEETKATLRSYLTSWEKGTELLTVMTVDGERITKKVKIPPKINLVLTVQEGIYDDSDEAQDESRFLIIELRRDDDKERQIIKFVQELEKKPVDISQDLEIFHAAWHLMQHRKIELHKEFTFEEAGVKTIREFKRFLTLLKCNALLRNRIKTTEADVVEVREFLTYSKPMLSSTRAARPRSEEALLQCLRSDRWQTVEELQKISGLSYIQTVRALRGRTGTFRSPSGGLLGDKRVTMQYEQESKTYSFKLK